MLGVGVGSGLQILADAVGIQVPAVQEGFRSAVQSPRLVPFLVLSAVVTAPVVEELFFRGLLYQTAASAGRRSCRRSSTSNRASEPPWS